MVVNHLGTSIVIDTNSMLISGLAVFGVNAEDRSYVAGAILGRIKPVTSILAEKGLACFSVVYFPGNIIYFLCFLRALNSLEFSGETY